MDLTIVTCNHNTPKLIRNLVKSVNNTCESVPKILVVDTGHHPTPYQEMAIGASYWWHPDRSHGDAVNGAMSKKSIKTRYMLLVDSDVLFLKDIKKPFEKFKESGVALMGEVVGDRGGKSLYPRVNPWFCFIDLDTIKANDIEFYDQYRTKEIKSEKIYDIGSTFYEDILGKGLEIGDAKMEGKYFKHYEGMSWRVQKYDPSNGDTDIDVGGTHDNKALYEYGLMVAKQYEIDIKEL